MTKLRRTFGYLKANLTLGLALCMLLVVFGLWALPTQQPVIAAADPATTAVDISVLESQGRFSDIYDQMHPDAQAFIPRAAVVGWYENDFAPLGPGVITVTNVAYVSWTWPVTGKTYPNTAEVFFRQPFADGTVVSEVVRLVESGGNWRWFFGRSPEFVNEQIARYGQTETVTSRDSGSCEGAAEWWKETMPNIVATNYLESTLSVSINSGAVDRTLLFDYSASFGLLREYQAGLVAPGAATTLQADFLELLELYEQLSETIAALVTGMNPMAESGAQAAVLRWTDRIRNIQMNLPSDVSTFLDTCEPLVVFEYGMGEDLPIGVLPGEVGSNDPMLDCSLIVEQVDAQQFFEASGSADPHGMDRDEDGRACEAGE